MSKEKPSKAAMAAADSIKSGRFDCPSGTPYWDRQIVQIAERIDRAFAAEREAMQEALAAMDTLSTDKCLPMILEHSREAIRKILETDHASDPDFDYDESRTQEG